MKTISELYSGNEQSNLSESLISSSASDMTEAELRALITGASYGDTVNIPSGVIEIHSTITIPCGVSVVMEQFAVIRAVSPFTGDYVLVYDGGSRFSAPGTVYAPDGSVYLNHGITLFGGVIDGNGIASCLKVSGAHHITLTNIVLLNGKQYGMNLTGTIVFEAIVNNCYARTHVAGCEGNIAFNITMSDCHFVDCIVVDYTTAFRITGGANRFARCHIWGGRLGYPDTKPMLENSIGFDVVGRSNNFTDCYADSSGIGFKISGTGNVLVGTSWFNNYSKYGLDNVTYVQITGGDTKFIGCRMQATAPNTTKIDGSSSLYETVACIGF